MIFIMQEIFSCLLKGVALFLWGSICFKKRQTRRLFLKLPCFWQWGSLLLFAGVLWSVAGFTWSGAGCLYFILLTWCSLTLQFQTSPFLSLLAGLLYVLMEMTGFLLIQSLLMVSGLYENSLYQSGWADCLAAGLVLACFFLIHRRLQKFPAPGLSFSLSLPPGWNLAVSVSIFFFVELVCWSMGRKSLFLHSSLYALLGALMLAGSFLLLLAGFQLLENRRQQVELLRATQAAESLERQLNLLEKYTQTLCPLFHQALHQCLLLSSAMENLDDRVQKGKREELSVQVHALAETLQQGLHNSLLKAPVLHAVIQNYTSFFQKNDIASTFSCEFEDSSALGLSSMELYALYETLIKWLQTVFAQIRYPWFILQTKKRDSWLIIQLTFPVSSFRSDPGDPPVIPEARKVVLRKEADRWVCSVFLSILFDSSTEEKNSRLS